MSSVVEKILREELRRKVDEYFGSFLELEKGPVFQVHAAMTRKGLTKAVRKTKRSQLADMERGVEYKFKTPKGVSVAVWADRWSNAACAMKEKTGFKWSIHRDNESNCATIVRVR